jgi:hypothetical protein
VKKIAIAVSLALAAGGALAQEETIGWSLWRPASAARM